jgi:hypothetical protein
MSSSGLFKRPQTNYERVSISVSQSKLAFEFAPQRQVRPSVGPTATYFQEQKQRMRIAVVSDIHGNCLALDTILADLGQHPVDHIVCLGDAILGGAQPAETASRLRALDCPTVLGNADAWLSSGDESTVGCKNLIWSISGAE